MTDLEPLIAAAQAALKTRNLSELFGEEGYAKRGTRYLNDFGWSRLTKLLIELLPFTAVASPQAVIELCAELKALRAENASLRICSGPPLSGQTAPCQSRAFCYYNVSGGVTATGEVYVPKHWPP